MLINILFRLFLFLIYTPKKYRTCEYGWHEWSRWDERVWQMRFCKKCGKNNIR